MNAKQLGKRLVQIVLVALGISFLTFLITYLAPGDPVRTMFAATGMMPEEELIQETREAMGLNRPLLVQYFSWLQNCLKGDLVLPMLTTGRLPSCLWHGFGPL